MIKKPMDMIIHVMHRKVNKEIAGFKEKYVEIPWESAHTPQAVHEVVFELPSVIVVLQ